MKTSAGQEIDSFQERKEILEIVAEFLSSGIPQIQKTLAEAITQFAQQIQQQEKSSKSSL